MKYTIESFAEYLLIETQTISQYLKSPKGIIISKQYITDIKNVIRERLSRFPELTGKMKDTLTNYLLYIFVVGNPGLVVDNKFMNAEVIGNLVSGNFMPHYGDFLIANKDNNQLLAKLNTTTYNMGQLMNDVEIWHEELKNRRAIGPEGRTVLELSGIGMKGWQWVSLDRGYCRKEGDAMGHCGNAAHRRGDNILSLRDPQGAAHLTFIVNNGILGESKGRDNSKPSKKYESAIMQLLLSPFITSIKGGGYKPENNFHVKDLSEENKKILLDQKPNIDFYDYAFKAGNKEVLEDVFNARFVDVKDGVITIKKHDDLKELHESIESSSKKLDNFYQIEQNILDHGHNVDYNLADEIYHLDRKMEKAITDYFEANEDIAVYDDDGDLNLEKSIENDGELESTMHMAMGSAYEQATYDAFYKDLENQLQSVTKNGFYIDFSDEHAIKIPLISAEKVFRDEENEGHFDQYGLDNLYDFEYIAGDNDYHFDSKIYNQHLLEELPKEVRQFYKV